MVKKAPIGTGMRWLAVCVLPLGLLLAMSAPCLSQPRGPGPRKPRGVDKQALESWKQLTPEEKRALATRFLRTFGRGPRRKPRSPESRLFLEAMHSISRSERSDLFQLSSSEGAKKLVELTDRFARDALTKSIRNEIPRDLEKLLEAGFVTKQEVERIKSMEDPPERMRAYIRLRNEVFLRQMVKTGRIDEATHQRIKGLESMRDRFRELGNLRRKAFCSVNAHLIHFMLRPFERVKLLGTRWSFSFHRRVRQLENKKKIRFFDIFPSSDPKRLSHLLRMTSEQEKRMNQENLPPEVRRATALEIYQSQREAFVEALVKRVGEDRARRVKEAPGPQSFYQRAFRMLAGLREIELRHQGPRPWGPGGYRKAGARRRGRPDLEGPAEGPKQGPGQGPKRGDKEGDKKGPKESDKEGDKKGGSGDKPAANRGHGLDGSPRDF